jgi:60 kDa SS-A/Ro ribonucleoprotein
MANYSQHFSTKQTPQSQPIPGKDMKKNSAGGYSFETDKWEQLNRFLILGTEGGTFYINESKLTRDNAKSVVKCIKEDGVRVVNTVFEVSDYGRAPKNDPAIFVLALCASVGDDETKKAAYEAIASVCRIGTHIFQFCNDIQNLRGWSRGLRRGVSEYYLNKTPDKLAYHLLKYQQRNGWTHKDVIRLSHPSATSSLRNDLLKFAVGKAGAEVHPQLQAVERLKGVKDVKLATQIIVENKLPREAIPTNFLNKVEIWEALLQNMPMTALVRNLGKMTSIGLLKSNLSTATKLVINKMKDKVVVQKSRIHPLQVLVAMKTYESGHGVKGSLSWSPVARIVDALDDMFYMAFDNIEPTGQNWLLGLDISGSMSAPISGMPLDCRTASAAMAMVTARTEPNHEFLAFTSGGFSTGAGQHSVWGIGTGVSPLSLSPRQRLDGVIKKIKSLRMGGTDCSLPMQYATQKKIPVDTFVIYTDSETWHGKIHPKQALDIYRQKMGIPAKCIVVGMASNGFTIADPNDAGMLDVVGFSTAVPTVLSEFSKGL